MIVSPRGGRILMVRQVDHQEQCGLMAGAWGNDAFTRIAPWGPVEIAAGCHDEGWRPLDDATEPDADGIPIDFPDLDRVRHVAMYEAGIDDACARDPRAGLLVSMHGQGLHEARLGLDGTPRPRASQEPPVSDFLSRQEELQGRLRDRIGDPGVGEWAWDGFRILQAVDTLSLHLLWFGLPRGRGGTLPRVPRHPGDPGVDIALTPVDPSTCAMDPYPFNVPVLDLSVAARWIENRPYEGPDDLRAALAAAEWTTERVRVRPA